jgi:hypothetical protein
MLIIKEKINRKDGCRSYYKVFYVCPMCKNEFPIMSPVYFCTGCYKSIVDIKSVLDNEMYALKYHFGKIKESGTYAGINI